MAVTNKCLVPYKEIENAQTTQYTASAGVRVILDKITTTNHSGAPATVTLYKVPSGGAAGVSNLVKAKTLAAGESYTWPELVGHTLNAGDFISGICTVAAAVNISISGRENTT